MNTEMLNHVSWSASGTTCTIVVLGFELQDNKISQLTLERERAGGRADEKKVWVGGWQYPWMINSPIHTYYFDNSLLLPGRAVRAMMSALCIYGSLQNFR